jgi:hypothetical protein
MFCIMILQNPEHFGTMFVGKHLDYPGSDKSKKNLYLSTVGRASNVRRSEKYMKCEMCDILSHFHI